MTDPLMPRTDPLIVARFAVGEPGILSSEVAPDADPLLHDFATAVHLMAAGDIHGNVHDGDLARLRNRAARLSAVLAAARAVASLAVPVPGHGMCILPARIDDLCVALAAADGAR